MLYILFALPILSVLGFPCPTLSRDQDIWGGSLGLRGFRYALGPGYVLIAGGTLPRRFNETEVFTDDIHVFLTATQEWLCHVGKLPFPMISGGQGVVIDDLVVFGPGSNGTDLSFGVVLNVSSLSNVTVSISVMDWSQFVIQKQSKLLLDMEMEMKGQ